MKHLTYEQVAQLLAATSTDRDCLLLTLCYEHGLRVSEALALTPARLAGGFLYTDPLKHGNRTDQKLAFATMQLIAKVCANLPPNVRVFPFTRQQASNIFHKAALAANIQLGRRQGIHTLRHSIARHLLEANAPLPVVQKKLGHKSLASTGHYLTPSDAEVDFYTAKVLNRA